MARTRSAPWWRIGTAEFRWLMAAYVAIVALHLSTAALFLFNTASGQAAGFGRLPMDDSWIHMVYARSFAEHFAFYYNPGTLEAGMTSPLWVVLLGLSNKVLSPTGIGLVATAKVLGILLAIGTSIIGLHLVTRITNNRLLGALAAGIITLDPVYSFAKVSGTEASLFGFLALGGVAAFYHNRLALVGVLLALAVAARPEGLVLVMLAVIALVLKRLWESEDLRSVGTEDVNRVVSVAGPPVLIALLIALYNASVNGTWYPNSYLVKHVELGLFNFSNLKNLVEGYILHTSFFGGYGFVATVPLLVLAGVKCFRQANFMALPLVLFLPALYYALSVTIPVSSAPWTFLHRRYLDPSLPFVAVGVVLGLHYAYGLLSRWLPRRHQDTQGSTLSRPPHREIPSFGRAATEGRPYTTGSTPPLQRGEITPASRSQSEEPLALLSQRGVGGISRSHWFTAVLALGFLVLLIVPFVWTVFSWPSLPSEYSWNNRNVNEVNVAMSRWVDQNLPQEAVVGVADSGAIRFFGNRAVVDLLGLNTHTTIGKPIFETAREHGVGYLIVFRNVYFDSWPWGEETFSLKTERNTILGGGGDGGLPGGLGPRGHLCR